MPSATGTPVMSAPMSSPKVKAMSSGAMYPEEKSYYSTDQTVRVCRRMIITLDTWLEYGFDIYSYSSDNNPTKEKMISRLNNEARKLCEDLHEFITAVKLRNASDPAGHNLEESNRESFNSRVDEFNTRLQFLHEYPRHLPSF